MNPRQVHLSSSGTLSLREAQQGVEIGAAAWFLIEDLYFLFRDVGGRAR